MQKRKYLLKVEKVALKMAAKSYWFSECVWVSVSVCVLRAELLRTQKIKKKNGAEV